LLQAVAEGDRGAFEQVLGVVYAELHSIAQARMGGERANHTLQPTALVNEAYLRLLGKEGVQWAGRAHFFRAAAEAMRKILIDHARARDAQKRGGGSGAKGVGGEGGDLAGQGAVLTANDRIAAGGRDALSIGSLADAANQDSSAILALDAAIVRLEEVDGQAAAVVRLKFFAGLPDEAVAEALEVSPRTVRRDWAFARGWLRDALERHGQQE
jgi:RNA polymerase sigma factor (sigma-70 family)